MSDQAETWIVELRVPPIPGGPLPGRRVAALLKRLGRAYGVRCVRLLPSIPENLVNSCPPAAEGGEGLCNAILLDGQNALRLD